MNLTWKKQLEDKIDPEISREIDVFEVQMDLRQKGKLDEKIFAEARLRRGIYGLRYDNGERHDGVPAPSSAGVGPRTQRKPGTVLGVGEWRKGRGGEGTKEGREGV